MRAEANIERVIALAGVFQAAALAQRVAREGNAPVGPYTTSMRSLFQIDAPNAEAVFGHREELALGIEVLCRQLGKSPAQHDLELTRYVVSLLLLERKASKRPDLLDKIRTGIETASNQADYFSCTHENVIAALAEVYRNTISTLSPRIMVNGDSRYLDSPTNASRIRALLLAGIRAAVLWRQLGGNRWRVLLSRRRIVETAKTLLPQPTA